MTSPRIRFSTQSTEVNPKQMLECRPNVSFCHLPLAFSGFVANDGGYLDAHELLLAPRRQLLYVTRGLTVPPWLLLRRHHNPRDVNIRLEGTRIIFPFNTRFIKNEFLPIADGARIACT